MKFIEKIKVLHVVDVLDYSSGVSAVVMNWFDFNNKDKYIFDFMVNERPNEKLKKKVEDAGSVIYEFPKLKASNVFKYIKELNCFFKNHKEYKIIHGHVANSAIFYLSIALLYKQEIRIIHSHNSKSSDFFYKRIRNYILKMPMKVVANHYMACSVNAAKFLFGKKHCAANPVTVIYNAVNINKFAYKSDVRKEVRNSLGVNDKFALGHIGRFCQQKNHDFLIDIFQEYKKLNENSCLVLIGEGELKTHIQQKVTRLGLEKDVLFLGLRTDVEKIVQAMDVFILPSLYEGLPVSGIETQASGLPCVFSKNVTAEIKINQNVEFVGLDENIKTWITEIHKFCDFDQNNRVINRNDFIDFDMNTQIKHLLTTYDCMLK